MIIEAKIAQQQARMEQRERNEIRRVELLPVACALRDSQRSAEVIQSALKQVEMWRSKNLCSRDYIDAWEALLKNPEQAAGLLEEQSPYAEQLRQNSPFVSTVRKYREKHAA